MPSLMSIDGVAVAGQHGFEVVNPSTGAPFAEAPACDEPTLNRAVEAASKAFGAWRRDESARRTALKACAAAIRNQAEALGRTLATEMGKPITKAIEEAQITAFLFDQAAEAQIPVEQFDEGRAQVTIVRRPLGVVAALPPWNFPLGLGAWKVAPALLTGNTVVLKPSPYAPLSSLQLGAIMREWLPPGVLNVISGGGELGEKLVTHPLVRGVGFTGSIATGQQVARSAATQLKRLTLELGGNDAAIVLDDVDPKQVASRIFWGAFANSGQICGAIKRLYVAESVMRPLLHELTRIAQAVRVGDALDPTTEFGPIGNRAQLDRILSMLDEAKRVGAHLVTGGERLNRPGFFVPPTLVTKVAEGIRLVDDEQFGPVLPIMSFRTVEEAIERANATAFGLNGSIWTRNIARGTELAGELECGTAWVNQHMVIALRAPFGGWKASGLGRENGPWGIQAYTEVQVIHASAD